MSSRRESTLTIETPEGVIFSFELATPVTRALAWAVDMLAIGGINYFLGKLLDSVARFNRDWFTAVEIVLYFAISIGYGIVLEWRWRGQTIGKRLLGLRVTDAQGLRLQFPQVVLRNVFRVVDMLPLTYLVGGPVALLTRYCQRLGDLAANTVVVHERRSEEPDLEQIAPAKYNTLLGWPHLAARLRAGADPEAVGIAVQAVAHRGGYEPAARVALFRDLADYFRDLARYPEPAIEGLTDEQFVRSVLRVIYNPKSTQSSQAMVTRI
jgi:uncharacterized RDD family membrane protein YckC